MSEELFVSQSAPTLAGIKTGNLFTAEFVNHEIAIWHKYAKIPRHTSKNAITEGDFKSIFARNCEGTEQLRFFVLLLR